MHWLQDTLSDPWFRQLALGTLGISLASFLLLALPWTLIARLDPACLRRHKIQQTPFPPGLWFWPSLRQLAVNALVMAVLLVLAERDGRAVAGALNFIGPDAIYGRYWGCVEDHPFLHFELCYHQAIDHAIEEGLRQARQRLDRQLFHAQFDQQRTRRAVMLEAVGLGGAGIPGCGVHLCLPVPVAKGQVVETGKVRPVRRDDAGCAFLA